MTDVALAKLASIQRCVKRVRDVTHGDPRRVHDIDVQDIVVLNLQRAIQAAIDLAAHVVAQHTWGLPDSLKAHFTILAREKVIEPVLCTQLEAMVGFCNIAVHDYETLDANVLQRIVAERLVDLEAFAAAIARLLQQAEKPGE